jgi:hypothetical protein
MKETARMRAGENFRQSAASFDRLKAILDEVTFPSEEERTAWREKLEAEFQIFSRVAAEEMFAAAHICGACVIRLQVLQAEIAAINRTPQS